MTYHFNLKHLVTLQKRAVRTISRSAFDAHTDPIFKSLKLLKFENIVSLQVAKIMYLYKKGQLPESFNNMFFTGEEIHNYNKNWAKCHLKKRKDSGSMARKKTLQAVLSM